MANRVCEAFSFAKEVDATIRYHFGAADAELLVSSLDVVGLACIAICDEHGMEIDKFSELTGLVCLYDPQRN